MSRTFTLKGKKSVLTATFFPPIKLEENRDYSIALIDLEFYNSLCNVYESCNMFYYGDRVITIPTGAYEIEQLEKYLQEKLGEDALSITPNIPTQQAVIRTKKVIDFKKPDTIGPMLGFGQRTLLPGGVHLSDSQVEITKVVAIMVDCNLVTGAYFNGTEYHTIHMFPPTTPPGYKIIEIPRNVLYLPVKTKVIDNITVKLTDQDGRPLDLRNETVTVRLHLKADFYDAGR